MVRNDNINPAVIIVVYFPASLSRNTSQIFVAIKEELASDRNY